MIDTAQYKELFDTLAIKSAIWSQQTANGDIVNAGNTVILKAGDDSCLQVFYTNDLTCSFGPCNIRIDDSLNDKTILINYAANDVGGTKLAELKDIGQFINNLGDYVSPRVKASILWNFFDAEEVILCGGGGGPQMPGSVLIPNGNLEMKCPGLDGRLIVGGDVLQNRPGSEFHNYEFDPPVCDLPCIIP